MDFSGGLGNATHRNVGCGVWGLLVIAEIFLLATVDPCPRDGNSFAVALRSSQRDWSGEGTGHSTNPSYSCSLCRVQTASNVSPWSGPWLKEASAGALDC